MGMSTIIAIETSSERASAALLHGDVVITRESVGVQTHSQSILPMVQALLAEAGIALAACDAIAFGSGPGSFTGVRTACGIAQGLAYGLNLPVVPVVTLAAMAEACREKKGVTDVLAILDARMDEVYWAHYRYLGGWTTVIEPTLSSAAGVPVIPGSVACGNGLVAYASLFDPVIISSIASNSDDGGNADNNIIMPHARHVARLAQQAFIQGKSVSARDAQPLYLRNKVALTTAERSAKLNSVAKVAA